MPITPPPPDTGDRVPFLVQLQEEYVRKIPPDFPVGGVSVSVDGAVTAWSRTRPELLHIEIGGAANLIEYGSNDAPTMAIEEQDGTFSVFVAPSRRLMRFAPNGEPVSESILSLPDSSQVVGGIFDGSTPVLATRKVVTGDLDIMRLTPTGFVTLRSYSQSQFSARSSQAEARVTVGLSLSHGGGLVMSSTWPPFQVEFAETDGNGAISHPIHDTNRTATIDASENLWVALPALPLDSEYIQTVSDLRCARPSLAFLVS